MKQLNENEVWTVETTTALDELVIAPGASLAAPAGKLVVLVADGTEGAPLPGTYQNAVVYVLDDTNTPVAGQRASGLREALYVDKGVIDENKSALAALVGGAYDGKGLRDVSITSKAPLFGGVVVADGEYAIQNLKITLPVTAATTSAAWAPASPWPGTQK